MSILKYRMLGGSRQSLIGTLHAFRTGSKCKAEIYNRFFSLDYYNGRLRCAAHSSRTTLLVCILATNGIGKFCESSAVTYCKRWIIKIVDSHKLWCYAGAHSVLSPPIVFAGWRKTKFPKSQCVYGPSFIVACITVYRSPISYFLSITFCHYIYVLGILKILSSLVLVPCLLFF